MWQNWSVWRERPCVVGRTLALDPRVTVWDAFSSLRPPCWEEAQAMGNLHVGVLAASHGWAQPLNYSNQEPATSVKKPLDSFWPPYPIQPLNHLQPLMSSQVTPDTEEQRTVIHIVPCLNFWPTGSISIIKWQWLRVIYYAAVDNWSKTQISQMTSKFAGLDSN